jgi:hypothetical protein
LASASALSSLEIEPVVMTPVWFTSAVFNHTTHRALTCAECHSQVANSRRTGDVTLLPGIAQCALCHRPSGGQPTAQGGGARTNCTECHRYHNGDHPGEGPGAAARRGAGALSLERFLRGGASVP